MGTQTQELKNFTFSIDFLIEHDIIQVSRGEIMNTGCWVAVFGGPSRFGMVRVGSDDTSGCPEECTRFCGTFTIINGSLHMIVEPGATANDVLAVVTAAQALTERLAAHQAQADPWAESMRRLMELPDPRD